MTPSIHSIQGDMRVGHRTPCGVGTVDIASPRCKCHGQNVRSDILAYGIATVKHHGSKKSKLRFKPQRGTTQSLRMSVFEQGELLDLSSLYLRRGQFFQRHDTICSGMSQVLTNVHSQFDHPVGLPRKRFVPGAYFLCRRATLLEADSSSCVGHTHPAKTFLSSSRSNNPGMWVGVGTR
ncbi:unnamed protein product, partial [Ectocarpus sp. 12 AP-2014]